MTAALRALVLLALLCACRREATRSPVVRDASVRDARALNLSVRVDDGGVDGGAANRWAWPEESALAIEAPRDDAPFELTAVCSAGELGVLWRLGREAFLARRPLRADGRWSEALRVTDDVSTLGRPLATGGAVWAAWVTPLGVLRAARVDTGVMRARDMEPGRSAAFRDARVIYAQGDVALVVSTWHDRDGDHVVLHRVGVGSAPTASATLGDGYVAAVLPGAHPRVVVATRVPRTPGGPWVLRMHRLDARLALAIAATSTPGVGGALPEGSDVAGEPVPVGVGSFEFVGAPTEREGALLFQTVLGAERGAMRVAWFGDGGAPVLSTLPVAATGLESAWDSTAGVVWVTYWDDRHALQRGEVTRRGVSAAAPVGKIVTDDHAVRERTRRVRQVMCGSDVWRVEAQTVNAVLRVVADRQ